MRFFDLQYGDTFLLKPTRDEIDLPLTFRLYIKQGCHRSPKQQLGPATTPLCFRTAVCTKLLTQKPWYFG